MLADRGENPNHVGIIMDGNGRWARMRGLPRASGHKKGMETAKKIVRRASEQGITNLSLYVFSVENWQRAEEEVHFLMNLIKKYLREQYDFYKEQNIRIRHSGDLKNLPQDVQETIVWAEEGSKNFNGMTLNLLINYGGRDEIIRGITRCLNKSHDPKEINEKMLSENLDYPEGNNLDFLIRTGGERRLSNCLLWQTAYAELYFSDLYWPDWQPNNFDEALENFRKRQRRFGRIDS